MLLIESSYDPERLCQRHYFLGLLCPIAEQGTQVEGLKAPGEPAREHWFDSLAPQLGNSLECLNTVAQARLSPI